MKKLRKDVFYNYQRDLKKFFKYLHKRYGHMMEDGENWEVVAVENEASDNLREVYVAGLKITFVRIKKEKFA